ncbi:MAG: Antidote-toxin recognition MazE, bacterial antitoxin [Blastocatellia bacterium]
MSTKNSTIGKIGQRRQVVIPKNVFDELGLQAGDMVEVTRAKGSIVITPKGPVDPDDSLTPEEGKIVRKGIQQLKQGRSKSWRQVKDELDH